MFRGFLFTRIVPVLRDIGLWGRRIRGAFEDMGVLAFADADIDELVAEDEAIAEQLDALRMEHVRGRRRRSLTPLAFASFPGLGPARRVGSIAIPIRAPER